MSTIDPVAREREPAFARRRRRTWLAVTSAVAALAGYGSSIFGDFPGGSVSFGLGEPFAAAKALLATVALGATILLLGVVLRLPRQPGVAGQPTFVMAIVLVAFDSCFFLGSFLPTSLHVYAHADLSGTRSGMRVVCGLLLVAAAGLVAWAATRERGRQGRERLRRTGRRVSAEVTEVHDTGITSNNAPRVRLTVCFKDAHGTMRFVRRRVSVTRYAGPSVGDHLPLWYDPADPGNEKKIVIGER
jgi:hypothetical protein